MKKSMLRKSCVLVATALALAITAMADETISANVTLTADADWRDKGTVTIPAGVTVNLNGYSLKLAGLAGEGTIDCPMADLTTTDASRVSSETVFYGGKAANLFNNNFARNNTDNTRRIIVLPQNLPLVVDYDFGEGNEQVVDMYKVYCGPIPSYTFRCPKSWTVQGSNDKVTWTVLDSRPSETGWTTANSASECRTRTFDNTMRYRYYRFEVTAVQDNSEGYLEMVQLEYFHASVSSQLWLDVPAGTTLVNQGVTIKGNIQLIKDGAGTFIAAKANQAYNKGTQIMAGTIVCQGGLGANLLGSGGIIQVETGATFDDGGWKKLQPYEIVLAGGKLANAVSGHLTMRMDGSGNYEIQDGATLNLAERADVLNGTNADSNYSFTFVSNATYTVNLAGRNLTLGDKLIRWSAKTRPIDATITFDDATAQGAIEPVLTDTGCFYGVDSNSTLAEYAVWNGGGLDGDIGNPANWTCTNVAGNLIDRGLPCDITTVRLAGVLDLQVPPGVTLPHEALELTNCQLGENCDWRGIVNFRLEEGTSLMLNGHDLKLSNLAGAGTIGDTPAANSVSDLTTTDASRVSSTTTFYSGTKAANLFNNNFARNNSDSMRRVIVVPWCLPLVVDYDFGEGNEQMVDMYKVYCGPIPNYTSRCPKSWTLQGSNDKVTWTVLDSRPSETSWTTANSASESRTKFFGNTTRYRYYRFKVTAVQDNSDGYLEMVQLEYFTAPVASKLWLDIPTGATVENTAVAINGNVRLIKDGMGTFVASKANQTYSGGTQVRGGTFRCGTGSASAEVGVNGSVLVEKDAVFDVNGWRQIHSCNFTLAGGALMNTSYDFSSSEAQISKLVLTADSAIEAQHSLGLFSSGTEGATLDLGDHTLTVPIGDDKKFYLFNATVTAGMLDVSGNGWLVADKTTVNASAANLRVNCALDIRVPFSVGSYEALYTGDNDAGSQPFTVTGVFTPHDSRYHGVILADGATLDLSQCTTALNVISTFTGQQLTLASGATVTLDMGDRRVLGGTKVVEWTEKPENLQPQQFKVKATERKYRVVFGDDGIYLKSGLAIYIR